MSWCVIPYIIIQIIIIRFFKRHFHYDLRKYYFGDRIISHWNSLPDYVINSNSIGIFENRLDLFWKVKIVIMITNPTWLVPEVVVSYNRFTFS